MFFGDYIGLLIRGKSPLHLKMSFTRYFLSTSVDPVCNEQTFMDKGTFCPRGIFVSLSEEDLLVKGGTVREMPHFFFVLSHNRKRKFLSVMISFSVLSRLTPEVYQIFDNQSPITDPPISYPPKALQSEESWLE